MEPNIAAIYSDCYYPIVLLDSGLNVAYKNEAARAAKIRLRISVNIKNYVNAGNLKILRNIASGKIIRQVIELDEYPNKCVAQASDNIIALIFLDSLNYIIGDCSAETAEKINKIAAEYTEISMLCISEGDRRKQQKIRGYFYRYIANIDKAKADSEKSYCDIWEFLDNFDKGASPFINGLGYRIKFDIGNKNKMFMHRLNESDFLTLNFILASYALSKSVFGILNIKYETNGASVLIYDFAPGSDFEEGGNIDLELAALIAENNNLKLEFKTDRDKTGEKTQIRVYFKTSGDFSQEIAGYGNIMNGGEIALRTEIELSFLRAKV